MSERGLAADEDHDAIVVLVSLEKQDNLSLHEEMVGGSPEPGQPPQLCFWELYCFIKMELVTFYKFVVNHIFNIEDLCWLKTRIAASEGRPTNLGFTVFFREAPGF